MKITIEGVTIELTKEQILEIEKGKALQELECKSFERILKHFGFTKMSTKGWLDSDKKCYKHESNGWFAEILDHRTWKCCFMAGRGLPHQKTPPGGYLYESPESIAKVLRDALDKKETL
ncbi:hypothetical protein KO02_12155 [Sphingobacterium sp. ML3W]|uniref:hypothetical protein n=1 Tax=Sphingobacterium sp. ML3W TaxID=1538644 RepID=UPI0004F614FD|nr:hypothetical protein [Sphingobacterium sp. ML3W]AIM37361.1 hypothetical protein KO02_12155 [Sphingobacterium sp. ML3W]